MKVSPLFAHAHDGKAFHAAVGERIGGIANYSMHQLCKDAELSNSTAWRWHQGSKPDPETVNAVEAALGKAEAKLRRQR